MITKAKLIRYDGRNLILEPDEPILRELRQKQVENVEIRIVDGRIITPEQRKRIFATIRDISLWSGHEPEYLRQFLTWDFVCQHGGDTFSLSNTDVTTAKDFTNYLINFCLLHNVPTKEPLLDRTEDIGKYLYYCLEHKKCAICNKEAEVHHVDKVGMGRDRKEIVHVGMRAIALCRDHHILAHADEQKLFEQYHIYGIKLDEYLCKYCLGLNCEAD
ncbi:putative HNHc nuclease [Anaerotignum sp. MB30-C6]|uniref:putative HNHc nuclease n=1 Tax=Anaerotignum sp. MB30-C6 TaxID=3070814 RepID=UPI0027DDCC2F|nr:putative HNHc nuclease [Anaerotignum sp. MB30-C6]WMI81910.1 putative HNHc nuclease [Anaerotignum sp. MB30-C6]